VPVIEIMYDELVSRGNVCCVTMRAHGCINYGYCMLCVVSQRQGAVTLCQKVAVHRTTHATAKLAE